MKNIIKSVHAEGEVDEEDLNDMVRISQSSFELIVYRFRTACQSRRGTRQDLRRTTAHQSHQEG